MLQDGNHQCQATGFKNEQHDNQKIKRKTKRKSKHKSKEKSKEKHQKTIIFPSDFPNFFKSKKTWVHIDSNQKSDAQGCSACERS